eukprot:6889539-Prymnesium_polylepis.1
MTPPVPYAGLSGLETKCQLAWLCECGDAQEENLAHVGHLTRHGTMHPMTPPFHAKHVCDFICDGPTFRCTVCGTSGFGKGIPTVVSPILSILGEYIPGNNDGMVSLSNRTTVACEVGLSSCTAAFYAWKAASGANVLFRDDDPSGRYYSPAINHADGMGGQIRGDGIFSNQQPLQWLLERCAEAARISQDFLHTHATLTDPHRPLQTLTGSTAYLRQLAL